MNEAVEKAMAELESAFDNVRNLTPFGRQQEMHRYRAARFAMAGASQADSYVSAKLVNLDGVVQLLAKQRQPLGFDEGVPIAHGLGDISAIRGHLHHHGLLADGYRPFPRP